MIQFTMTYIIANKSKASQKQQLRVLLKRIFKRDIDESPDIHVLNPEEKNSIGIEEVKEFQKTMRYKPFQEERQVGIILQAQKLTAQAQNALLKTLEETTATSIYILCVDNDRNLLPTIKSRGIVIYSPSQIVDNDEVSEQEEELDELKGFLNTDLLEQFNIIEKYSKEKDSSLVLIDSLETTFKDTLELDIKNGNIDSSQKNLSFLKTVQKSREKIAANCNRRLTLESLVVQLNT
jgi:DNA polymerase III subunit delta'